MPEWDKQPPEEKADCMFRSWNNTRRRVAQRRGCNIAKLWGGLDELGMHFNAGSIIIEFEVQNLNFSNMWLDVHQNVKVQKQGFTCFKTVSFK
jgi:hypothetical protein